MRVILENLLKTENRDAASLSANSAVKLQDIDISLYRQLIAEGLIDHTGLCDAIPAKYSDFIPVVRDGVKFLFERLSTSRMLKILAGQMELPENTEAGQRLLSLVMEIPTLHKLGQIIARTPQMDPDFKKFLVQLEHGPLTSDIDTLKENIEKELGRSLESLDLRLANTIGCQASVALVVDFVLEEEAGNPPFRECVFKALKPSVPGYLDEEMEILRELSLFYEANRARYCLKDFSFSDTFSDVREALAKEIDLGNERKNLQDALTLYENLHYVKIPRLAPLSTPSLTSMEKIDGTKITEAKLGDLEKKLWAKRLFKAIVCHPIFSTHHYAIFHGDPHGGNVFLTREADGGKRQIALLDWSQAGILSKPMRYHFIKLAIGLAIRDPQQVLDSVAALSESASISASIDSENRTPASASLIERVKDEIEKTLSGPLTGIMLRALNLLDEVSIRGVKFNSQLFLFRKAIFTITGVINDLDPEFDMDENLFEFMAFLHMEELPGRWFDTLLFKEDDPLNFRSLISNRELLDYICRLWIGILA
jgi:ubiquinone biosynthesis protein